MTLSLFPFKRAVAAPATDTPRGAAALWGFSSLWTGTSSLWWRVEARWAAHEVTRFRGSGSAVFSPVAALCSHHRLLPNISVTPKRRPRAHQALPQPRSPWRPPEGGDFPSCVFWPLLSTHSSLSRLLGMKRASWICVLDAVTKDMGARSGMGSLPSRNPGSCQRRDLHTNALGVLMGDVEAYPAALVCCLLRAQP